jgi:hypothetical protein
MQIDKYVITVKHAGKFDAVLLGDMIAARAWSMDGVSDAESRCITNDAFTQMARDLASVPYKSVRDTTYPALRDYTPTPITQVAYSHELPPSAWPKLRERIKSFFANHK